MKFDFWGQLLGKALRRQVESEVTAGFGPVLAALRPVVASLVQQEAQAVVATIVASEMSKITSVAAQVAAKGKNN